MTQNPYNFNREGIEIARAGENNNVLYPLIRIDQVADTRHQLATFAKPYDDRIESRRDPRE